MTKTAAGIKSVGLLTVRIEIRLTIDLKAILLQTNAQREVKGVNSGCC